MATSLSEDMTPAPLSSPEEHPLIGQILRGTYRILSALDQGGMGLVFEAEHTRLRRRVAVKVLARHLIADAQALARFNREAEIISQLEHPNIVQILDFDTTEQGEPYIVMELLRGESLSDRLERDGWLPVRESALIVQQVAAGLFTAHHTAIVHRDLKPANIFLTTTSAAPASGPHVKLLDFGISKRIGAGRKLTGEYDVLGTPDYMSPEQALGKTASVDHRADQYALAVIAFETLSGQTPFSGTDLLEVLRQVVSVEPPPIERFAPHVPASVGAVLRRGLQKTPGARYETVREFATAFAAACADASPSSKPVIVVDAPSSSSGPEQRAAAHRIGHASTLAGNASLQDIPAALERARQALGLGDLNLAVAYAESALRLAQSFDSPEAERSIDAEAMLIDHIFETRIGSLRQYLSVVGVPSSESEHVSPEQAFLLSRLDDGGTVEEVLDLSPMSRRDTLRLLLAMLRDGLIVLGTARASGERRKLD